MLAKTDLKKIQKLLTGTVSPLKKDINGMKGDISNMQGDISNMQGDISNMQGDISNMQGDISSLNQKTEKTKKRIDKIGGVVGQLVEKVVEINESVSGLKDKIGLLPTKEEYFSSMDKLMGEVKTIRELQEASGHQLADHSDKLESHEERIGNLERKTTLTTPPV